MNCNHLLKFDCIELCEPFQINGKDVVIGKNEIEVTEPHNLDMEGALPFYFKCFNGTISNVCLFKTEPQK